MSVHASPPTLPTGPRLVRDSAGPERPRPGDAVGAWLDVLGSLLHVPAAEREAIREELEAHLRERVRDLILSGRSEPDAVSAAIAEVGDAAALARRFHHVYHAPRRRFIMHTAILGLAGAAMITSLVALRGGTAQSSPASVFQPPAASVTAGDVRLSCMPDTTWEQLFSRVGESAKKPVFVYWNKFQELRGPNDSGVAASDVITGISFADLPLARALSLINQMFGASADDGIEVREQDGVLVFSTVAHLDRMEQTLATFDLSGLVAARRQSLDDPAYPPDKVLEEATKVIQSLVHSDLWQDNGGDRAQISVFDSRLFIKAPRRIMPQVEWVIGEMNKSAAVADAEPGAVSESTLVYALAHADAISVQQSIAEQRAGGRVGRAKVLADPSTNSVIVTGTSKEQGAVAALLQDLDRTPARPLVPVRVISGAPAVSPPAR